MTALPGAWDWVSVRLEVPCFFFHGLVRAWMMLSLEYVHLFGEGLLASYISGSDGKWTDIS